MAPGLPGLHGRLGHRLRRVHQPRLPPVVAQRRRGRLARRGGAGPDLRPRDGGPGPLPGRHRSLHPHGDPDPLGAGRASAPRPLPVRLAGSGGSDPRRRRGEPEGNPDALRGGERRHEHRRHGCGSVPSRYLGLLLLRHGRTGPRGLHRRLERRLPQGSIRPDPSGRRGLDRAQQLGYLVGGRGVFLRLLLRHPAQWDHRPTPPRPCPQDSGRTSTTPWAGPPTWGTPPHRLDDQSVHRHEDGIPGGPGVLRFLPRHHLRDERLPRRRRHPRFGDPSLGPRDRDPGDPRVARGEPAHPGGPDDGTAFRRDGAPYLPGHRDPSPCGDRRAGLLGAGRRRPGTELPLPGRLVLAGPDRHGSSGQPLPEGFRPGGQFSHPHHPPPPSARALLPARTPPPAPPAAGGAIWVSGLRDCSWYP